MKAFGIPLTEDTITNRGYCFGICIDEDGRFLGQWTSSNYSFLESDLKTHAVGYEYKFLPMPDYDELVRLVMLLAKYQEKGNK
jgi:hypothetical protein